MIRTQIQITEQQADMLKDMADRQAVSMAEIIRRAIDQFISSPSQVSDAEQRRRALSFVGRFSSGVSDLSENHDRYLAEIYAEVEPRQP